MPRSRAEEEADALGNTAPWAIEAIRRDERRRLADLLHEHADLFATFTNDPLASVRLVAFMIGLGTEQSDEPEGAS